MVTRAWLVLLLYGCVLQSSLAFESRMIFTADRGAAQAASRYAQDMVQFAQIELHVTLDWSDESVAMIEEVASELHADLRRERGHLRDVDPLMQMLGSYLGEVYRRNHGGEWGFVATNGKRLMAIKAKEGSELLWPIERIKRRIRGGGGGSNNVWAYYQSRIALANH